MFNMNADKFLNRMFRKAEGVVWDLMTGKVGVQVDDGIATLDWVGEDNGEPKTPTININILDDFGMPLPAFAQSTPVANVQVGDIIYRSANKNPNIAWIIEKRDNGSFKLMKPSGDFGSFIPPKVSVFGLESGVMVLRSLVSMMPNGQSDVASLQGMLMPMMLMGGMGDGDMSGLEKMIPLMLMGQMSGGGMGGNAMLQAMMFSKLLGNDGGSKLFGGSSKSNPFERTRG